MAKKSMTDIAFDILSEKTEAVPFAALWKDVSEIAHKPMDAIGQFYNDLSLDPRFSSLEENKWDLKARYTFEQSHIDLSAIELGEDEEEAGEEGEFGEEEPVAEDDFD